MMNPIAPRHSYCSLPLILPALLLAVTAVGLELGIFLRTGHFVYPLDDPYIHLAMARHFAESGIFGVSLAGFSASSSSPLWTLLVAFNFWIFGNHEIIPFLLNLLAAVPLAWRLTRHAARHWHSEWTAAAATSFFLFALPLPALISLGMEHTLHILLVLLLVSRIGHPVPESTRFSTNFHLFFLGFAATLTRYETGFVTVPLLVILALRRDWTAAATLAAACALPVVMIGGINAGLGWHFFPNSVLMKSVLGSSGWEQVDQIAKRFYGQLLGTPHLLLPFAFSLGAGLYTLRGDPDFSSPETIRNFVFPVALMLHCSLALIGWFYRYEAYLLALGWMALVPFIPTPAGWYREIWTTAAPRFNRFVIHAALVGMLLLGLTPFWDHLQSIRRIVPGAENIYHQQYQMGLFLRACYNGATVAANDIGAINYLADIECLDLMGLGSREPGWANAQGRWGAAFIESWCRQRNARIAVIYESWFRRNLPESWIKIGEWTVNQQETVADTTVAFFALSPDEAPRLRAHLEEFSSQLPPGIQVRFIDSSPQ
ncbi:MAG: hypothetical protein HPY51_01255 [Candidatus Omnitrophica bacterium]|nr:hypothetical protein [Candidatus Omnitrophota bacterium]